MKRFWSGLLHGLLCFLLITALALGVLASCDWLYRADIRLLKIPEASGLSEAQILESYHGAMRYLAPWDSDELSLGSLPASEQGLAYFARLRLVFLVVYALGLVSLLGLLGLHRQRARLGRKVWNGSGVFTLVLAAAGGVLLALDFEKIFSGLASLLFPNDLWGLYEDLDPVVKIFPQSYFLHAGFFIVFCLVAGALLQFVAGYVPPETATGRAAVKEPRSSARPAAAPAGTRAPKNTVAPCARAASPAARPATAASDTAGSPAPRAPGALPPDSAEVPYDTAASSPESVSPVVESEPTRVAGGPSFLSETPAPAVSVRTADSAPRTPPVQKQVFRLRDQPGYRK